MDDVPGRKGGKIMGIIKGQKEYLSWQNGKRLTIKQAVLANCYMCNGLEESSLDCKGQKSCPMYPYSPYGRKKGLNVALKP